MIGLRWFRFNKIGFYSILLEIYKLKKLVNIFFFIFSRFLLVYLVYYL